MIRVRKATARLTSRTATCQTLGCGAVFKVPHGNVGNHCSRECYVCWLRGVPTTRTEHQEPEPVPRARTFAPDRYVPGAVALSLFGGGVVR